MRRTVYPTFVLLLLSLCAAVHAQATATPAKKKSQPASSQAPDVAAPKLGADGSVNPGFEKAHERFVEQAKEGTAKLIFLGDSITAGWAGKKEIWDKAFGQYQPANFGIGGDRTQHVLWRINNGELEWVKPQAVVLMIGTNNASSDSAEGIASGFKKIVETIRNKQPQAKILLLAVFPRGEKAEGNASRDKLAKVNRIIKELDDGQHVYYLDIGNEFLQPDGSISKDIMPDYLHLSAAGYQIWADAIGAKLAELMTQAN